MTESNTDNKPGLFIRRLENLDAAGRARLKRNAGRGLAEARDVVGLFYSILPSGVDAWDVDRYFLLATLYPLAAGGGSGSFGNSLRMIRNDSNSKGLDRRVEHLLDADREQLPFRLRQSLHYLQGQRGSVAWQRFLADLLAWDHPARRTQRRWAEDYFAGHAAVKAGVDEPESAESGQSS